MQTPVQWTTDKLLSAQHNAEKFFFLCANCRFIPFPSALKMVISIRPLTSKALSIHFYWQYHLHFLHYNHMMCRDIQIASCILVKESNTWLVIKYSMTSNNIQLFAPRKNLHLHLSLGNMWHHKAFAFNKKWFSLIVSFFLRCIRCVMMMPSAAALTKSYDCVDLIHYSKPSGEISCKAKTGLKWGWCHFEIKKFRKGKRK